MPYCLSECAPPPPEAVVGELTVSAIPQEFVRGGGRTIVTGEELDRMTTFRPAILWIRVDSAGVPNEIRLAQSSGVARTDQGLIETVADYTLRVTQAGWYRTRVEPPRVR